MTVKSALFGGLMALLVYVAVAVAITWPVATGNPEIILGGGELGGWLWRQWWHFQEVDALSDTDLGFFGRLGALVGLGRFPETGNILDILLISYPLEQWFGFPDHHNLKVLVILAGNGLCGFILARSFTESWFVSLAAGLVAVVNPVVFQDINKTGLRQTLLWWLLLYPVLLGRAERSGRPLDGAAAGAMLGLVAGFYWFYGLFAAVFTVIRLVAWGVANRWAWKRGIRWGLPAMGALFLVSVFFVSPYLSSGSESGGKGGVSKLPELSFFLEFPSYDTIASAPLRPSNYRENVLSSLHRTIDSAWAADYVVNPGHGVLALPLVVMLLGVVPAFFIRGARVWLGVWTLFYVGTLGPFLKWGAQQDTADVVTIGEYVVRLPYVWMFEFIPGMSRMFAPYRMGSMMVVASVALLAICIDRFGPGRRGWLGALAAVTIGLQPFYRFDLGPVAAGTARPAMWRIPTQISGFKLPNWYKELDPDGWEGIIELPLEQQQDLICAYQSFHRRKVYRSWATEPALPPAIREVDGGEVGKRLRWLAMAEPHPDPVEDPFRRLSREPLEADLNTIQNKDLSRLLEAGSYRWLVVHERGYYLVRSNDGGVLYRHVVKALAVRLGVEPVEMTEISAFDWPGKRRNFPVGPAWVPWASQEVQLPTEQMPVRYQMAVFDLEKWIPQEEPATQLEVKPETGGME